MKTSARITTLHKQIKEELKKSKIDEKKIAQLTAEIKHTIIAERYHKREN